MTIYSIELNNTYANQEFDLVIEEIQNSVRVLLQTINEALFMSVWVNNEQIGQAFICLPNQPIIPYPYLIERFGGNFVFETQEGNYPNFENFGKTCNLYFLTLDEFNAVQNE